MTDRWHIRAFLALFACLWFSVAGNAQRYEVISSIPFTGDQTYWDYLLSDAQSHKLYVTRGNEVLILDLDSGKQLGSIGNLKRVHGVAVAHELNKGFITDGGDNAVVVFDLASNAVTQQIKVGNAPDAVLYEPTKGRVYAFNAHSHNASLIDAQSGNIVATVPLSGIPEFAATDGRGNVFVNIESKNSLVRLAPDGTKVEKEWSLSPCEGPSGLAIDAKGRRLFSVCDNKLMIVTDADSGKQIAQVRVGVEPDAAIYDAEQKLVFASNCDGTLTVVKQEDPDHYTVLQNVKTEREARTMALNPVSHKLFLPSEQILPGSKPPEPGNLPEFTPGTFHMMIVAPQM
ncbi:MAG TPA: YncE family protein [Candidatus Binatia bacterium]|nr:YncE family protein [Candidatus Binatia bacterium]